MNVDLLGVNSDEQVEEIPLWHDKSLWNVNLKFWSVPGIHWDGEGARRRRCDL